MVEPEAETHREGEAEDRGAPGPDPEGPGVEQRIGRREPCEQTEHGARAGDAGRGFAIVASEVKNLASETAKATEEIAQQVAGIQSSTKSAVEAFKEIATAMRSECLAS